MGQDNRNNYVYKRDPHHSIRFSDYHPKTNTEGFFYNLLLAKIPFRDEFELMSEANDAESFMWECRLRDDPDRPAGPTRERACKILEDEDDLERMVNEYCERHMFR